MSRDGHTVRLNFCNTISTRQIQTFKRSGESLGPSDPSSHSRFHANVGLALDADRNVMAVQRPGSCSRPWWAIYQWTGATWTARR
jgi:hypothetical protein